MSVEVLDRIKKQAAIISNQEKSAFGRELFSGSTRRKIK